MYEADMAKSEAVNASRILQVIGQIYDAALDPVAMQRLPLAVARLLGSESCVFHFSCLPTQAGAFIPKNTRLPVGTANFDAKDFMAYAEYYHERNEWYARGWKKGFPAVVLGQELLSNRDLLRTEWYDFCQSTRMYELLGAQCLITQNLIGCIGVHRPRGAAAFDETDRHTLSLLLPHLQRVFQLYERLERTTINHTLAADLLDSLSVGMVLVGTDFRLLFASALAERILRAGHYLSVSGGRLRTPRNPSGVHLQRLIAGAVRTSAGQTGGSGGSVQLDGGPRTPLSILVSPLRLAQQGLGLMEPAAILIFSDPDASLEVPASRLRQSFRLTPAELRLLSAILQGQRLTEYAGAAGITYGTVRIHLKRLLQKMDCHSQADLVRTVLRDPLARLKGWNDAAD